MARAIELVAVVCGATVLFEAAAFAGMSSAAAVPSTADLSASALALCRKAEWLSGSERQYVLNEGLELAQHAVAVDADDAKAHFAVFCNLGRQIQSHRPGLRDLGSVRRLRQELDTAIELAPDYTDALVAKGALLLALPRFLGGNAREGEELLRSALRKDPANVAARQHLIAALRSRGAVGEADALASLDTGSEYEAARVQAVAEQP